MSGAPFNQRFTVAIGDDLGAAGLLDDEGRLLRDWSET